VELLTTTSPTFACHASRSIAISPRRPRSFHERLDLDQRRVHA
jgi:hypothetical protein